MGSPEPGLSFEAPKLPAPGNDERNVASTLNVGSSGNSARLGEAITAESATEAATLFGNAIVAGQFSEAFELLPTLEQQRIGSSKKFAEVVSRDGVWLSSSVDPAETKGEVVALRVSQTPMIDEIRGVVAPVSVVKLPAFNEAPGWKVSWERRTTVQQFGARQGRLTEDVLRWATAHQKQCARTEKSSTKSGESNKTANDSQLREAPEGEYAGGLLGTVGLAEELCTALGAITISTIGDIYNLDDPQPLLDAFGSGSYQWARVVTLGAPHAMNVIAAPLDQRWVVVGLAPVSAFN